MQEDLDLVDATEGTRITGLDKSTIYKLARTRRVRSFKVLNALRFDRRDLMALVKERTDRIADAAEADGPTATLAVERDVAGDFPERMAWPLILTRGVHLIGVSCVEEGRRWNVIPIGAAPNLPVPWKS